MYIGEQRSVIFQILGRINVSWNIFPKRVFKGHPENWKNKLMPKKSVQQIICFWKGQKISLNKHCIKLVSKSMRFQ